MNIKGFLSVNEVKKFIWRMAGGCSLTSFVRGCSQAVGSRSRKDHSRSRSRSLKVRVNSKPDLPVV